MDNQNKRPEWVQLELFPEMCTSQGGVYPKYKALILRTIHRLRENGYMNKYSDLTDEEIFEWWISKENMQKWYYSHKVQLSLFDMDEYKKI
jgi:hypothetical protein